MGLLRQKAENIKRFDSGAANWSLSQIISEFLCSTLDWYAEKWNHFVMPSDLKRSPSTAHNVFTDKAMKNIAICH